MAVGLHVHREEQTRCQRRTERIPRPLRQSRLPGGERILRRRGIFGTGSARNAGSPTASSDFARSHGPLMRVQQISFKRLWWPRPALPRLSKSAVRFRLTRSFPSQSSLRRTRSRLTHRRNGCGRGSHKWAPVERVGSWDAIDNGRTPSATSILPAFQTLVNGDVMPAIPGAKDAFIVAAVDPPRGLMLTVPDGRGGAVAWEHVLKPLPAAERGCSSEDVPPRTGWSLLGGRRLTVTAASSSNARMRRWRCFRARCSSRSRRWHRIMEARHLRGIQRRSTAAPPIGAR